MPKEDKRSLDTIIGNNVRLQRMAHNLSMAELSKRMEITYSHLGLIERGERGTTSINLRKLSKIFNVTIDSFFVPLDVRVGAVEDTGDPLAAANRKKVQSLMTCVDDSALDFVVNTIKGVIDLTGKQ